MTYFSEMEAKGLVGKKLKSVDLESVKPGTVGEIIGARPTDSDGGWLVKVRWNWRRSSFFNLMVGDACLSIPSGAKTMTTELSRSDSEAKCDSLS